MGFIGGSLGYHILKILKNVNREDSDDSGEYQDADEKLTAHFGSSFYDAVKDKTVIDFGCGAGHESVECAKRGARKVIGIDVRERLLDRAAKLATDTGVWEKCYFVNSTDEKADIIFTLDSFEHFDDPAGVLEEMGRMLNSNGEVWVSFGWPWYHPYGGHLFSVFPWAHLVFTEKSLIRWRSDFKADGATRFREVEGGLNQMSVRRFKRIIELSCLECVNINLRPIRPLRWIHNKFTCEFTTALVQCRLQKNIN
jgi:SAM-dependent methyltransferase